jgi:hypothetical protein
MVEHVKINSTPLELVLLLPKVEPNIHMMCFLVQSFFFLSWNQLRVSFQNWYLYTCVVVMVMYCYSIVREFVNFKGFDMISLVNFDCEIKGFWYYVVHDVWLWLVLCGRYVNRWWMGKVWVIWWYSFWVPIPNI